MTTPSLPAEAASLVGIAMEAFPALAQSSFTVLAESWDSIALDVDDRLILKFPRHERAEQALRREAGVLAVVGTRVSLPIPKLELFEVPRLFSRHSKLRGGQLLESDYRALPDARRQELGDILGKFHAELHAIPPSLMEVAGARPLPPWLAPEPTLRRAWPVLDEGQRTFAERTVEAWAALPPDPFGKVFGHFDGHGWNMAFDHEQGRLNGIYDFADSGIGPLHQEFVYSSLVSPDLTARIILAYERESGRMLDRSRIAILIGAHRLWEVATEADSPETVGVMLGALDRWIAHAGHKDFGAALLNEPV